MQEYQYFKQTGDPEIHAAIVDISRKEWKYSKPKESLSDAYLFMKENQFDILPKINKDGSVSTFYHTEVWGNYLGENIKRSQIKTEDNLCYLTHIWAIVGVVCWHNTVLAKTPKNEFLTACYNYFIFQLVMVNYKQMDFS